MIVKFVSGAGNVVYTPTTGNRLGAVIMTPDTGSSIAMFVHSLPFFNTNTDAGAYDLKASNLSDNCLTQIANICAQMLTVKVK